MNYDTLKERVPFIGMFVGDSGSGKSVAEASFVEEGPLKIYDLDRRSRGIVGGASTIGEELLRKNLEIDRTIDVTNGFLELDKQMEMDLIKQKTGDFKFKTIVIDSFPTLNKILMYDSMRLRSSNKDFKGKVRGKLSFPHPDDYNYASSAFHQIVYSYFLLLKCNVILSAWTVNQYGKDPSQDANEFSPNVILGKKILATEKLSAEAPGYFDEVYYFSKEETGIPSKPVNYYVEFETSIAKTSNPKLKGRGKVNITDKSFYRVYKELTGE